MFRFDKGKSAGYGGKKSLDSSEATLTQSNAADVSIDYANYLMEIQEGKKQLNNPTKTGDKVGGAATSSGFQIASVEQEEIDFSELKKDPSKQ